MSTSLTIGKARVSTVTVVFNGTVDTASELIVGSGNPSTLRVRVNPNSPREVGVLGLAESSGVNASCTVSGHTTQELFVVSGGAPVVVPDDGPRFGTWSVEIDPPDWLAL